MKKLLLVLMCGVMISCVSVEKKVEKLINVTVEKTFNDPDTYEMVEYRVDTLKDAFMLPDIYNKGVELYDMFEDVTLSSMEERCKEIIEHSQLRNKYLMLSFADLAKFENEQAIEKNNELIYDTKRYINLCKELDSLKNCVQMNDLKYLVYHKYRCVDSSDRKILQEDYYLVDAKVSKIEYVYDVLTYDLIKTLVGSDLKGQIKGVESYFNAAVQINDKLLDLKKKL